MNRKPDRLNDLDQIAQTLLIPLCYRAVEARQPDALVRDPCAQEIIDRLGVDPAHLRWRPAQQFFAMLRARQFDRWTRAFLERHPQAVAVEIGCGLDARFERVDNGTAHWVDLDLPEVATLRRQFFTDSNRRLLLARSVFDLSWLDAIPAEGAHLFLAEGVFPYFEEAQVRRVILALAGRFPGSELVVDVLSPFMVHTSAFMPSFRGYRARPRWGVSDPWELEDWGSGIRLLESWGYFDAPEPRLASVRWMAWVPQLRDLARVLHLRLGNPDQAAPSEAIQWGFRKGRGRWLMRKQDRYFPRRRTR